MIRWSSIYIIEKAKKSEIKFFKNTEFIVEWEIVLTTTQKPEAIYRLVDIKNEYKSYECRIKEIKLKS